MPVQHVELHRFHPVKIALEDVDRNEVAGDIDQQSTPGETRPVFNGHSRDGEAVLVRLHELQESLHSAHQTKRIGSVQMDFSRSDLQTVGFIFAQSYILLTEPVAVKNEISSTSV